MKFDFEPRRVRRIRLINTNVWHKWQFVDSGQPMPVNIQVKDGMIIATNYTEHKATLTLKYASM